MFERFKKPEEPLTTSDLAGTRHARPLENDDHEVEDAEPIRASDLRVPDTYGAFAGGREIVVPATPASEPPVSAAPPETVSTGRGTAAAAAPAKEPVKEPIKETDAASPLFSPDEARNFRTRWDGIQVGFVDEPRQCVEQADQLVAETMKRLAEIFADEREQLEHEWDRGGDVSTEDLRLALRRYRSFFGRLLAM